MTAPLAVLVDGVPDCAHREGDGWAVYAFFTDEEGREWDPRFPCDTLDDAAAMLAARFGRTRLRYFYR
jgi:hypothetical protein